MTAGAPFEARRGRFRFEGPEGQSAWRLAEVVEGRRFALDLSTIAARLVFGSPLTIGATPYVGVRAIYTRPPPLQHEDRARAGTPLEAAQHLREGLESTVARALEGARRVAVLTGGGLDSSVLLALAHRWAREHDASAFAVAMDFGGPGDDRPHLDALARHLDCEVVRVRPEDAAHRIDLLHRGVDAAPFTWPSGPMEVEALARARANGAEVVLTGVGADELLDGEPRALARTVRRNPLDAVRAARRLRGFDRPRSPVVSWLVRPLVSRHVPRSIRAWRARRQQSVPPSWAGPVLVEHLRAADRSQHDADSTWERPYHEHLAWLRHQEDVAAEIACLQPYLDPGLRALVGSFDPAWLLHGAIRRGLFREAFRDLLPRSLLERVDKASFELALRDFVVAAGGFDALRPLASATELASLGLVRTQGLANELAALARSPEDGDLWGGCWPVLSIEAFLRGRKERGPS